ncbi:MAG: Gfo/Idh/MocA family oxidoreductase [Tannerellaceae bacterium]|jgi:virulence factor|nr:Gfo/Idh/MocA family oxidoreductase [Tannerellaceae bacterium]
MENPIELLKRVRKRQHFLDSCCGAYAFVGIGNHSLHNLYPVIHYLHVPLKYIVVKNKGTADLVNSSHFGVSATTDLEAVLQDRDINGIFISAAPQSHYGLVKKCLQQGKNVFVEKPPCQTFGELTDLIAAEKASQRFCLAGLQKRYSSCVNILRTRLQSADVISYNYRFLVGAYPEGDTLRDIYIHPLDLISFLFGEPEQVSVIETGPSRAVNTLFLQVRHRHAAGILELSTQYAWNRTQETLSVNTGGGIYSLQDHRSLIFEPKSRPFFSIPREKIFHTPPEKIYLFDGNSFLPVFENNQLVSQGYFSEIKTFVRLCEKKKAENLSTLSSLSATYKLIKSIASSCTTSKTT